MSEPADRELLDGFLEEARGYLPGIRSGLAAFRADPGTPELLAEPYRFVHTIKGAAAMVGLAGLSEFASAFENAVERLIEGRLEAAPDTFAALDLATEHVTAYLDGAETDTLPDDALPLDAIRSLPQPAAVVFDSPPDPLPTFDDEPPLPDGMYDTPLDQSDESEVSPFEVPPLPAGLPFPAFPKPKPQAAVAEGPSAELLEIFQQEADEHLRALTTLLPLTKKDPTDKQRWQEVRRAAHTLKGTAGMVGFRQVTDLSHRMEDLLDQYYEGTRTATPDEVDLLLEATNAIEDAIAGRGDPAVFPALLARLDSTLVASEAVDERTVPNFVLAEIPTDVADAEQPAPLVAKPAAAARKAQAPPTTQATAGFVRVPIERLNEIVKLVGELVINRTAFEQRMGEFARLLGELDPSTNRLRRASAKLDTEFEAAALSGGRFALASGGRESAVDFESTNDPFIPIRPDISGRGGDGFDALEFDRYTEFHAVSRELAETTSDVQTLGGELGDLHIEFDGLLTRQARLSSELEDKLMRLRMVPFGGVAAKLERTVREAAKTAGKRAELILDGERTGLDKQVLEAMADPLLHLLRNAVDHGLESPEARVALGKPAAGTVTLHAGHEGSQVVLTITDDGRGIDADAVRRTAVSRGVLSAADSERLTTDQMHALLFAPGFSTKDEISELSGRGVGLDVVKSKVESLKGTVTIASAVGRGTTFTIRLPMTLAVTRALLVKANQQTFAVPLEAVEQILRPDEGEIQRIGADPVVRHDGKTYPVVYLGRVLGLKQPADDSVKKPPILLLNAGGRRAAVVVEYLFGGREVVIKNLGTHLKRVPAVSGATLMGDGSVVLILNPAELLARTSSATAAPFRPVAAVRPRAGTTVMVVDDSPSVRRVLTSLVERNGWTAVACKDGLEAVESLQRGAVLPDVVLTDIEMPRMDGYDLLGTLRGLAAFAHLPVVVITSRAGEKHRRKALDLGASGYVTKPYQDEALVEVIRQLARKPG